jgi:hypothetical protein
LRQMILEDVGLRWPESLINERSAPSTIASA